jgi:hypothetical protein
MNTLLNKQDARLKATILENELETKFTDLTGVTPSIISPENKPFASFRPKDKSEYLAILNALQPTNNFTLTFAGKESIPTFSPYSIHYGGKHSTSNYMEATVKFNHSICPIWIKMPDDVRNDKFTVRSLTGEHKGFGHYEIFYTLSANGGTKVQVYYGESKTMYAATEEQANELKQFIFN